MAGLPEGRPLLYAITDRRALSDPEDIRAFFPRVAAAGVDLLQVRERDLETRPLLGLVETAVAAARGGATRVLVNDRLDVALAAGAEGVHLPGHGLPAVEVRRRFPDLLIGVSCHGIDELRRAEAGGADFAVFGPVFETPSKKPYGPPQGLAKLAEATQAVKLPVLALGGVTLSNARACLEAGAAGLAAISLFQASADLVATVKQLRALASA